MPDTPPRMMNKDLTVLVAVYDEAPTVEEVVGRVCLTLSTMPCQWRVLVLNDGSKDWTDAIERRLKAMPNVEVRSTYPNRGKGIVLGEVFASIDTPWTVVIDGDGEYAAADIPAIVAPLWAGDADWVLGSRYGFGRPRPRQYFATYLVNRSLNCCFRLCSGMKLNDMLSGLYGFRSELVSHLTISEKKFAFIPELMWKAIGNGALRWKEVPIAYQHRRYSQGKKIRWWETFTILLNIFRYKNAGKRKG